MIEMAKNIVFEDPVDAVLYLPVGFSNYCSVLGDFSPLYMKDGLESVFAGSLTELPSTSFKRGRPQTKFSLTDGRYYLRFVIFGDVRKLVDKLEKNPSQNLIYVHGIIAMINGNPYLNNAKFVEEKDAGTIKPIYPGLSGKMKSQPLASHIAKTAMVYISEAAQLLRGKLFQIFSPSDIKNYLSIRPGLTLEVVLKEVHYPTDYAFANYCLRIMTGIATILAASDIICLSKMAKSVQSVPPIAGPAFLKLTSGLKYSLTDEQESIVKRNISQIAIGNKINGLILGDVGTGKTIVYSLIAAYVAYGGGRVVVMLPNTNLCRQIHNEFDELFPDLNALLVTSDETDQNRIANAKVLIGTTALLFRETGEFALAISDESQKMTIEQQQLLIGPNTHSLSVSATPIPRTMALAQYGAVTIDKITKCHAVKTIYTRVLQKHQWQQLIDEVLWAVLGANKQAIVVCARKEDEVIYEGDADSDYISAEEAYRIFEPLLPGQAALSHSGLSSQENAAALDAMRAGSARLLIATTVIEVGVTLPEVVYLSVLNAQQFGLSQLHQLRGRLCRLGGEGWLTLYVNRDITNPKTIQRLNIMTQSNDGFYISHQDMLLRGVGDLLNATSQHGKYVGLIKNADVTMVEVERVIDMLS
ncbi:DEAD/DEAH box helicase [Rheinheimera sp.]|uniref:DEAD/DEAH box helicase n=1 Tax=Rheinheimera sp. TaxID=1869214 RepID=UPI00404865F0